MKMNVFLRTVLELCRWVASVLILKKSHFETSKDVVAELSELLVMIYAHVYLPVTVQITSCLFRRDSDEENNKSAQSTY